MKKKKMEQSFTGASGDGDSYITFAGLWQEACRKRRCRNNHGVFMEHKPV
ncbi:hypothetical protein [Gallintestinimicrobium sp.]